MSAKFLVQYISVLVWSIPPFRQYKGNFFYYFLLVGISDPLVFVLHNILHPVPSNIYYVLTLFAEVLSIIAIDKKIRWKLVIPVYIAVLAIGLSIPNWDISYIFIVLLVIILFYFIRYIIIFAAKNRYVSLFHILFLIYNTSLLLKTVNAMADSLRGPAYYHFTTIFDIMLGLLFCLFREEDKLFSVKLSEHEAGETVS